MTKSHDQVAKERFRVRVRNGGLITHESHFDTQQAALDYYDSLALELGVTTIEYREAGSVSYRPLEA